MKYIQHAPISQGTRVFVRLDIDVPIADGKIGETYRLYAGLDTLNYIIQKGGIPIIAGHIGQPKGIYNEKLSTKNLLPYFDQKLGAYKFELLENLRFNLGEEKNSLALANELAKNVDMYVNESFATSHRPHASIITVPTLVPAFAGLRLQKEITILEKVKNEAKPPFVVIIGGAKLESKLPVISTLLQKADKVLLGSKLALEWEGDQQDKLVLPVDYATDNKDIGDKTIELYRSIISTARTVLWAGPMGMYEDPAFIKGTKEVAQAILDNKGVWSILGGGDTIASLDILGIRDQFSFISTGGGAMLDFLADGTLPGIEVLK